MSSPENANSQEVPQQDAAWRAVKTSYVRGYCFTHHDYTPLVERRIQECGADYIIYGREICPKTGRPHLQGYFYWKGKKKGLALIKAFPGTQFRVAYGDSSQNFVYCTKSSDIFESGKKPMDQAQKGKASKDMWSDIIKYAKAGNIDAIEEEYPSVFFNKQREITQVYHNHMAKTVPETRDGEMSGVWIVGPPGCGKSSSAREMCPNGYYSKSGNDKWWCGYEYQDDVIIDDFDPTVNDMSYHMKLWTDRYKVKVEPKNGFAFINPKRFIVTSNYTMEQCFKDPSTLESIKRRFPTVIDMGNNPPPKKRKFEEVEPDVDEIFL